MNWTKTIKSFAIILFLGLAALAVVDDLGNIIFHHYRILSTLISCVKEVAGYAIRIGILLILVEISENIYAIRNGGKGLDQYAKLSTAQKSLLALGRDFFMSGKKEVLHGFFGK